MISGNLPNTNVFINTNTQQIFEFIEPLEIFRNMSLTRIVKAILEKVLASPKYWEHQINPIMKENILRILNSYTPAPVVTDYDLFRNYPEVRESSRFIGRNGSAFLNFLQNNILPNQISFSFWSENPEYTLASWNDSLEHYDQRTLYVRKVGDKIEYMLDKKIKGGIAGVELRKCLRNKSPDVLDPFQPDNLKPYLPNILQLTAARGHTKRSYSEVDAVQVPQILEMLWDGGCSFSDERPDRIKRVLSTYENPPNRFGELQRWGLLNNLRWSDITLANFNRLSGDILIFGAASNDVATLNPLQLMLLFLQFTRSQVLSFNEDQLKAKVIANVKKLPAVYLNYLIQQNILTQNQIKVLKKGFKFELIDGLSLSASKDYAKNFTQAITIYTEALCEELLENGHIKFINFFAKIKFCCCEFLHKVDNETRNNFINALESLCGALEQHRTNYEIPYRELKSIINSYRNTQQVIADNKLNAEIKDDVGMQQALLESYRQASVNIVQINEPDEEEKTDDMEEKYSDDDSSDDWDNTTLDYDNHADDSELESPNSWNNRHLTSKTTYEPIAGLLFTPSSHAKESITEQRTLTRRLS